MALVEKWKLFKEKVKQIATERSSAMQLKLRIEEKTLNDNLLKTSNAECENSSTLTKGLALIKTQINQIHQENYR